MKPLPIFMKQIFLLYRHCVISTLNSVHVREIASVCVRPLVNV